MVDKTVLEFFAGIGLMRLGLERAGWKTIYANDIAEDKFQQYRDNFQDADDHFSLGDIHTIDPASVPTATLATASFPCTDLSLAGGRTGLNGKQSSAFWGFVRILEAMDVRRPPIVLLENVIGFLTSHQGRDFEAALTALNQLGYSVDAFIIDAERFVPQSRVRLFVVGRQRDSSANFDLQETSSFYASDTRPETLAKFIFDHPEIDWCIRDLPTLPTRSGDLDTIVEELPENSDLWWSRKRTDYLISQMSASHRTKLEFMKAQNAWSYGTVFRRVRRGVTMAELRTDGVAGCLRTPKGGSARQILVRAGRGKVDVRLLSSRECARLMGADDFVINVGLTQALFGFGDAVCVPVVTWIAEKYFAPLRSELCEAAGDNVGMVING